MILTLEATDRGGSVGLASDGKLIDLTYEDSDTTHSERIMPAIDNILDKRDLGYDQLDCVAVATGPGSFTAIRLAVTTAKTLAMVCEAQCVGVTNLRLLAEYGWGKRRNVWAVIDARRNEFYTQKFQWDSNQIEETGDPKLMDQEEFQEEINNNSENVVIARERNQTLSLENQSNTVIRYPDELTRPLSAALVPVTYRLLRQNRTDDPDEISPTYVRKTDAQKNR